MAYTIYEYETVTPQGEAVEPYSVRTASQALGAAMQLGKNTVYVAVVPDAAMYLRISPAGTAATAADHYLVVGTTCGFPVAKRSRPYLYGLAA